MNQVPIMFGLLLIFGDNMYGIKSSGAKGYPHVQAYDYTKRRGHYKYWRLTTEPKDAYVGIIPLRTSDELLEVNDFELYGADGQDVIPSAARTSWENNDLSDLLQTAGMARCCFSVEFENPTFIDSYYVKIKWFRRNMVVQYSLNRLDWYDGAKIYVSGETATSYVEFSGDIV